MIEETLIALLPKLIDITWDMSVWMFYNPHLSIPVLLLEFIVLMKIWYAVKDTGKWYVKPIKYASGFFFLPQDFVVQCTAISILMLELPPRKYSFPFIEGTVTARMQRYKREYSIYPLYSEIYRPKPSLNKLEKWRYYFAFKLCKILHKFDKGHCE